MYLFVYGTLQDLQRLRAVVGAGPHVCVVGPGTVGGVLYDVGEYPALRPSDSPRDAVPGVLLELDDDCLKALDRYEGIAAGLYVRERVEVALADAAPHRAWAYLYNRPVSALRRIASWPAPRVNRA